jgi:hypothetical protein
MANAREAQANLAAGRPGSLARDFADFVRAVRALFDPYRPELHYMRGPGPKWRAKYAPTPVAADMRATPMLVPVKAR